MKHLEDALQTQCVHWFKMQYPKKMIFAVPNEHEKKKFLTKSGRWICPGGQKLNAKGRMAGVSDLIIPEPTSTHHGAFIEMKVKPNRPTAKQKEFLEAVKQRGYHTAVCYSFEEFVSVVNQYVGER